MKLNIQNSFSVVYAGNIGKAQSLQTLVKAASLIKKYKSIKVFIIGDGSELENVKKIANNLSLQNIIFCGYINEDELINLLKISKILYLSLINDKMLNSTVPSKTFKLPSLW